MLALRLRVEVDTGPPQRRRFDKYTYRIDSYW